MDQTNQQWTQPEPILLRNWLPSKQGDNIWVHQTTQEQAHRHIVRINSKDLARQTKLFKARMSSHKPNVCRLLYFHAVQDRRAIQEQPNQIIQMAVYTDRILPLRQWTLKKVLSAVHGLRRLVRMYGPIQVTEGMLGQNECGQVKVWLNSNPACSHPDSKQASEEHSVSDFVVIISKRCPQLANVLLGCSTFREAAQRISCISMQVPALIQSHSLQVFCNKTATKMTNSQQNPRELQKNVFGQRIQHQRENLFLLNLEKTQSIQNNPQSVFLYKGEDFCIKATNSITLGRSPNRLTHTKPRVKGCSTKFHQKFKIDYQRAMEKRIVGSNYRPNEEQSKRGQQPAKPFGIQSRFETSNLFPSAFLNSNNIKRIPEDESVSHGTSYNHKVGPISNISKERVRGRDGEKKIMMSNQNYRINNQAEASQLRPQSKKEEFLGSINPDQPSKINKDLTKFKDKNTIPIFLQRRIKSNNEFIEQTSQIVHTKSHVILHNKQFASLSPLQSTSPSPNRNRKDKSGVQLNQSEQKTNHFQVSIKLNQNRYKLCAPRFNFGRPNFLSPPGTSQNVSSLQKRRQFEFKVPSRTKTTQFFQRRERIPETGQLKIRRIPLLPFEEAIFGHQANNQEMDQISIFLPSQKIVSAQDSKSELIPKIDEQVSPTAKGQGEMIQLKMQLRKQLKFLLEGKQKNDQSTRTTLNSKTDETNTIEGQLKEKIIRKQMVFAELKKEALKVLTDA